MYYTCSDRLHHHDGRLVTNDGAVYHSMPIILLHIIPLLKHLCNIQLIQLAPSQAPSCIHWLGMNNIFII